MRPRPCARRSSRAVVVACIGAIAACAPLTPRPRHVTPVAVPSGAVQVYAVGDIADCGRDDPPDTAAARTARLVPRGATVLGLGDMAYPYADAATLARCYEPTWGAHRARTIAVPGNHDYVGGGARDFRAYFGTDAFAPDPRFVAFALRPAPGWLLVGLDSNVSGTAMEAQRDWLVQALDRQRAPDGSSADAPGCVAAMWHTPLVSSGWHRGSGEHMRPLWEVLDAHGGDLVLSGHEHFYEAFEPVDSGGRRHTDGTGLRQFTVGTGGAALHGFWRPPYTSRARVLEHGVLQLTLERGRYAWRFIDEDGRLRDAGAAACRGAPPGRELR